MTSSDSSRPLTPDGRHLYQSLAPSHLERLGAVGLGADWASSTTNDQLLSAISLYVSLSGVRLWRFVTAVVDVQTGILVFETDELAEFLAILDENEHFTALKPLKTPIIEYIWRLLDPTDSPHHRREPSTTRTSARLPKSWYIRERTRTFALHFKNFEGWPAHRVEVHIDPVGTAYRADLGGSGALASAAAKIRQTGLTAWHLLDYSGYRDIERIARHLEPRILAASADGAQSSSGGASNSMS